LLFCYILLSVSNSNLLYFYGKINTFSNNCFLRISSIEEPHRYRYHSRLPYKQPFKNTTLRPKRTTPSTQSIRENRKKAFTSLKMNLRIVSKCWWVSCCAIVITDRLDLIQLRIVSEMFWLYVVYGRI
jgi:hypothetical protein